MAGNISKANDLKIGKGIFLKIISGANILFLITPLIMLVIFSFNSSKYSNNWEGFSLKWYNELFRDETWFLSLKNSIIIAFVNTLVSTVFGTMAALALGKYNFKIKPLFQNLLYIPIILPEIIFAIALLSFYVMIKLPLGIISIICSHITFSIPFVILIVLTRILNFDLTLEEASLDLGATRRQTFKNVILPGIYPAIISSAIFAFTLSFDDFIITFFTSGAGVSTLPLKIYSILTKTGITPAINAVSAIMICATIILLGVTAAFQKNEKTAKIGLYAAAAILFLLLGLLSYTVFAPKNKNVLHISNWGGYLDETIVKDFEKQTGIKIILDYFSSNEELLAKMQTGAIDFDLIVVSTYMVDIMKKQKLLSEYNHKNIPNYKFIDERFKKLAFDPTGKYYIPYAYGFTGIGYNSKNIADKITGWADLWNEKYKGRIIMLDDGPEVFDAAISLTGHSLTEKNLNALQKAYELLLKQKKIILKYDSNTIADMLFNGEADLIQIWNGSLYKLSLEKPELKFVVPKGSIMFIDNLCLSSNSKNKQNAEKFLNFLYTPEISARNMNYIAYAMPVPEAVKLLDDKFKNNQTIFPDISNETQFNVLIDLEDYMNEIEKYWVKLKSQ